MDAHDYYRILQIRHAWDEGRKEFRESQAEQARQQAERAKQQQQQQAGR